jgi:hypothetical protein
MQTNVDAADQNMPNQHSYTSDRLSDTYVIRKTADTDNTEEYCYICFEDWKIRDGMVWFDCGVAITGSTKTAYPSLFSIAVVPFAESGLLL